MKLIILESYVDVEKTTPINDPDNKKKAGLNCYKYVFFSKSGFENAHIDNVEKINIDTLFELEDMDK